MTWKSASVQCKYCGSGLALHGTRMCDGCWELAHRFHNITAERLATIIAAETSDDFVLELVEELRSRSAN